MTVVLFGEIRTGFFLPSMFHLLQFSKSPLPTSVCYFDHQDKRITARYVVDTKRVGEPGSGVQPWGTPEQQGLRSHRISRSTSSPHPQASFRRASAGGTCTDWAREGRLGGWLHGTAAQGPDETLREECRLPLICRVSPVAKNDRQ